MIMTIETLFEKVKFLVDSKGMRTHAVLPIQEYEELMEDMYDLSIARSRVDDEDVPLDEALKSLNLYE